MTTATAETNEPRVSAEEQARIVCSLLKEYADKLAALNTDLIEAKNKHTPPERTAWLLDRGELCREPLAQIISRGSGLLEHAQLETITEDELALRMREIEVHLHHTLRLTHEIKQLVDDRRVTDQVAKLRFAAGLSAMKGGPLRPNE